ncbi:MAG: hypothetical protein M1546_15545 [Chloroflexi bacterium]|nr:hypothetical protein [Chloroflexota bacterium]
MPLQRQVERGLFVAGLGRTLLRLCPLSWRYSAASGRKLATQNARSVIFSREEAWGIVEAIREVGVTTNCGRFFREVGGQRIYMAVTLLRTNERLYATWSAREAILREPPTEGQLYCVAGYNCAQVIPLGQELCPVCAAC